MKRHLLWTLIGCLTAASLGWVFGKHGTHRETRRENALQGTSLIPVERGERNVPRPDYTKVATSPVSFKATHQFHDTLTEASATKLGGNPVAFALIGEMSEEEIKDLLPTLLTKKPLPESLISTALGRWAASAPKEALQWAETHLDGPGFAAARGAIIETWAAQDPQSALSWLQKRTVELPKGSKYRWRSHFYTLFNVWAQNDAEAALEAVLREDEAGHNVWFGFCQLATMDAHRQRAFEVVLAIDDEANRQKGLESLLLAWGKDEPANAAAWLDENAITDSKSQWAVSQRFQRADPAGNADWLLARTSGEEQERSLTTAIAYWSRSNPEAASTWVEESGVSSDAIAQQLADGWTHRDSQTAITWALRVKDEDKRKLAIGTVLYHLQHRMPGGLHPKEPFTYEAFTKATNMSEDELSKLSEAAGNKIGGRM